MNAKNIVLWVIAILNAALFIFAGFGKVTSNPQMVANFAAMGHTVGFLHFIGACELLGGIGLLIPRTRFWAAAGLIPIMIGACWTHISRGEMDHLPVPAASLITLVIFAYLRRNEMGRFFAKGNLLAGV